MSDRKPSIHSSRATVGSAEELDAYGVWVKSGPQDYTTAFGAGGFDGDDLSFGADFNSGFESSNSDFSSDFDSDFDSGFDSFGQGMAGTDRETRVVDDDFPSDIFSDELDTGTDDSRDDYQEDMPTQILMKMADEITSIRSELTTLKKEFENSLAESGGLNETPDTPSSDEGGDFPEDLSFDSRREEDEAALRSLSEPPPEEESVTEESFGELDDSFSLENIDSEEPSFDTSDLGDTAFNTSAFDTFSSEETSEMETHETKETETVETAPALADVLTDGLTDDLSGEIEGSSYLEDDPFASINADFEDMSLIENALDESELDENSLDIKLDESDFDFDLNSLSADPVSGADDELSLESLDSAPAESDSIDLSDIAEPSLTESSLDESFDLETKPEPVEEDSGIAKVIPEAFEVEAEEEATPFDDDLEGLVEEELSADIDETNITDETDIAKDVPVPPEKPAKTEKPAKSAKAAKKEVAVSGEIEEIPPALKSELRDVLSYMDHLLESLPEDKIEEFARSEHFDTYKKLFKDLDIA